MRQPVPDQVPTVFDYQPPTEPWLSILYEDDDLLILDKPSGLLSVPGKDPALFDSLQSRVLARTPGAGTVHRLDKDTSGVIVMAKSKWIHGRLGIQFEKRIIRKRYIARVSGTVAGESGEIDLPLATDWERKPRQRVDFERGRPSRTLWRVLERGGEDTRLALEPVTGRTHQLRVHLLAIGHPILGDPFYAEGAALAAAPRLLLHAEMLGFIHPGTGEPMDFVSPAPF